MRNVQEHLEEQQECLEQQAEYLRHVDDSMIDLHDVLPTLGGGSVSGPLCALQYFLVSC